MTDPRELLRRLKATEPYPAQAVIAGRLRLEANPDDPLDDLEPYAADQARRLYATIQEMIRVSGGGC
ncbi:MAG: hypothetical protein FJX53_07950 [Alphaproteobacteria bacterium]|nr:hypothetical protein [Alphaproteobacteria bacterium]